MRREKQPIDAGESRPARLRILDKEVQIACKPGEEDDLMQAAAYIDKSMRELRQRNATSSIEKIAIVTAINTANALLKSRSVEAQTGAAGGPDGLTDKISPANPARSTTQNENQSKNQSKTRNSADNALATLDTSPEDSETAESGAEELKERLTSLNRLLDDALTGNATPDKVVE